MSANQFTGMQNTSMMSGLLYAMKNECDCPGCVALRDMSDKLITEAKPKKPQVKKRRS